MRQTALNPAGSDFQRTPGDRIAVAATRLYDAEIALHIARQTRVEAWIAAAYDGLHSAVCEHRAALAAAATALAVRPVQQRLVS